MTTPTEVDLTDARDVLTWLLTEEPASLHFLAFMRTVTDPVRSAVVANAGRAWNEACAALSEAEAANERVRTLHGRIVAYGQAWCTHCLVQPYPCSTIRALEGRKP